MQKKLDVYAALPKGHDFILSFRYHDFAMQFYDPRTRLQLEKHKRYSR